MRSLLYALARLLGDLSAVGKGPGSMARRYVRRRAIRKIGGMMR